MKETVAQNTHQLATHNINRQEKMTKANILITIATVVVIIMMIVITILGTSPLQKSLSCPISFKCHNFVWLEFLFIYLFCVAGILIPILLVRKKEFW